jgi:hypothetical protein
MSDATYQLTVEKKLCSLIVFPNSNTIHTKLKHFNNTIDTFFVERHVFWRFVIP